MSKFKQDKVSTDNRGVVEVGTTLASPWLEPMIYLSIESDTWGTNSETPCVHLTRKQWKALNRLAKAMFTG